MLRQQHHQFTCRSKEGLVFLANGTCPAFSLQTEELQLNLPCSTVMPQWAYKWNMPPCQATVPHDLSQNSPAPCSLMLADLQPYTHTQTQTQSKCPQTYAAELWDFQANSQTNTCIQRAPRRHFFSLLISLRAQQTNAAKSLFVFMCRLLCQRTF